ncbi:MAG: hypothetical protein AAFR23_07065, partial [Pseudomonadota bacterium]
MSAHGTVRSEGDAVAAATSGGIFRRIDFGIIAAICIFALMALTPAVATIWGGGYLISLVMKA